MMKPPENRQREFGGQILQRPVFGFDGVEPIGEVESFVEAPVNVVVTSVTDFFGTHFVKASPTNPFSHTQA